jgi:hypothetical protein
MTPFVSRCWAAQLGRRAPDHHPGDRLQRAVLVDEEAAAASALVAVGSRVQRLAGLERSPRDPPSFELFTAHRVQVAIEPLAVEVAALKAG